MRPAIPDMHVEFNRYRSTAVVPDPDFVDDGKPDIDLRESKGLPGRAPHVELVRDGHPISAIDLYMGNFVLVAGPEGTARRGIDWRREIGVDIECHRIGTICSTTAFCERYGIELGAYSSAPDGYVAWRSQELPDHDCGEVLVDVLERILSRADPA